MHKFIDINMCIESIHIIKIVLGLSILYLHGNTDVNGVVVARRRVVGFNFEAAVTATVAGLSSQL